MKNWILRASAAAFAAGLMGSLACGGTSPGCDKTNINADSGSTLSTMQCGPQTVLRNNECVPAQPSGNSTTPQIVTP